MSPHGHEHLPNRAVQTDYKAMPITVIGIGFRGRGDAKDIESFYKLILEAREAWSPVPNQNGSTKVSIIQNQIEIEQQVFF